MFYSGKIWLMQNRWKSPWTKYGRLITGCLKPTAAENLYLLGEITPPRIKKRLFNVATWSIQCIIKSNCIQNKIKETNFMKTINESRLQPEKDRITQWSNRILKDSQRKRQHQDTKRDDQYWRTINRIRIGCARKASKMTKLGLA